MESHILNRINKLKQDLHQVSTPVANKSDNLEAYLSQSFKNPSPDPQVVSSNPHLKQLLEEKSARISELEDELTFLRESSKLKEQDLVSKYESAIDSIKNNCESLLKFYESQMEKFKLLSTQKDVDEILENMKILEEENEKLRNDLKNLQNSHKKEKILWEQEISSVRSKNRGKNEEDLQDLDEMQELQELQRIKDKLKKEIANLERTKNEEYYGMVEDFEEKHSEAVRMAQKWESMHDKLVFRIVTELRNLKIEIFEVKNEILVNFEDSLTCASSIISRIYKKFRLVTCI
jgi:chromosome segregation ATPase